VALVAVMGGIFYSRFRGGAWMKLRVIGLSGEKLNGATGAPLAPGTTEGVLHDWPEAGD